MSIPNRAFGEREKRYKIMKISTCLFFSWLLGSNTSRPQPDGSTDIITITHDLPTGTEIQAVAEDPYTDMFMLRLWNANWDIIPEGHPTPDVQVNMMQHEFKIVPAPATESRQNQWVKVSEAQPVKWREFL